MHRIYHIAIATIISAALIMIGCGGDDFDMEKYEAYQADLQIIYDKYDDLRKEGCNNLIENEWWDCQWSYIEKEREEVCNLQVEYGYRESGKCEFTTTVNGLISKTG